MARTTLALLVALSLTVLPGQGCLTPEPDPGAASCPEGETGYLAIAIQEGGLDPHPEVYTLETDRTATGIVLARGGNGSGPAVGVPDRALTNVTEEEVRRVLAAAAVPDEGRWNVTRAYQARVSQEDLLAVCLALEEAGPDLQTRYPAERCRDGTTLTLRVWTPAGLRVSVAECDAGGNTPFETVHLPLRNATLAAQEQAGVSS